MDEGLRGVLELLRQRADEARSRRSAEEQAWASALRPVAGMPGYFQGNGRIFSNDDARGTWEREHDPADLLALLDAGKADLRTQRLAAELIRAAAPKALPKRHADREYRDGVIARCVVDLLDRGIRVGKARALVAETFGLNDETVRAIMKRPGSKEAARLMRSEEQARLLYQEQHGFDAPWPPRSPSRN
jgi:hypothetical protein